MTSWEFWIDRGGTFTDVLGKAPDGALHVAKLLSSEDAPAAGVRTLLERARAIRPGAALPVCRLRLGTTLATNALLERRGVATLLVANRGLGDLIEIGTQERPELFELEIRKPQPLARAVITVAGRSGAQGELLEPLDEAEARAALAAARTQGLESVAIALIHATRCPDLETRLAELAREVGFETVVASHQAAHEIGLLARGETAVVDAYLTPLLQRHCERIAAALPDSQLRFMQSSGGLTEAARFRGSSALLSGPAGGVVAAARVAAAAGAARAIAFDMGGTSTDVSLIEGETLPRSFETQLGGVRVKAPMLRVHSIAAGGGSLCRFDGFRLEVGPESAGSHPGPLCYGDPAAHALTLTDVNFALGRVQPDRFPLPLAREPAEQALRVLQDALRAEGFERSVDEVAAGCVAVANASMAEAISQVTTARGVDPRSCALIGFGGASGQHVCALARALGIREILLHPLAGVLSAWGIGQAQLSWDGQRDLRLAKLPREGEALPPEVRSAFEELAEEGALALRREGADAAALRIERSLDLRYAGSETPLSIRERDDAGARERDAAGGREPDAVGGARERDAASFAAAFEREHAARFGYLRAEREIEMVGARVQVRARDTRAAVPATAAPSATVLPAPLRHERIWFPERGRVAAPLFAREQLAAGARLTGPALVLEETGTLVLDPGFALQVEADGLLRIADVASVQPPAPEAPVRHSAQEAAQREAADPVRLEVFGNRFMSIAEQMGAVLRNTSVSTNIKERLDYSCAVFDAEAGLVANAPHIPVHLGAMGETVRIAAQRFPDLAPGDVVATNDPSAGGSHLPDVTVVSPVFAGGLRPRFFVASRGHHADIGGTAPGSMPADSHTLEEEGVLLEPMRIVRAGRFDEERVRERLVSARYPARAPQDNLAELEAMLAANRHGVRLLEAFAVEQGAEAVARTMAELQRAAAAKVRREIAKLPDGVLRFADRMDDATPVCVTLRIEGERMLVDFEGTGPASAGNLNAPRSVVHAAVLYVLRCLVAERIPLNGGCLEPVEIRIPQGSLLDPPPGAAVVGGNVETSQRLVDVLLGALGRVAASQGTMNNVAFGDARFGYYETLGGGAGAGDGFDGASGVHTHMTNTRITDAELLESRYPVRLLEFSLRRGSGGAGRWHGGDGLVRRYAFLAPVSVSLLTERRVTAPYGLAGGEAGRPGRNRVVRADGSREELPHRARIALEPGDQLVIETPGGGGFGPRGA